MEQPHATGLTLRAIEKSSQEQAEEIVGIGLLIEQLELQLHDVTLNLRHTLRAPALTGFAAQPGLQLAHAQRVDVLDFGQRTRFDFGLHVGSPGIWTGARFPRTPSLSSPLPIAPSSESHRSSCAEGLASIYSIRSTWRWHHCPIAGAAWRADTVQHEKSTDHRN